MVSATTPTTRPPLGRLIPALVGVCMVGAVIGAVMVPQSQAAAPMWVLILGATLPGVAASSLLLLSRPAMPAGQWAMPVLVGTMARAFLTLLISIGVVQTMPVEKSVFLLTVLGVLLACLAIEVGAVLNMVQSRGAGDCPAPLEGARS